MNGSRLIRSTPGAALALLLALAAGAGAEIPSPKNGRSRALFPALLRAADGPDEPGAAPSNKSGSGMSKEQPKSSFDLRMSGIFALRFEYDDNIIHYSDEDLLIFTTQPSFGKFSITQAGDWIIRPRLDLTAETKALTGKDLEAQLRLTSWRYVENSIKSNESYQLRLKHPGFGRDNFQLTFYHAPLSYIRNFRDRAPFTSRAAPLDYTDFSYTSTSITLGYWRRLSSSFDGKLEVKHSWRFFNQAFMENDTWEWRAGGYITWRAVGPLRITGEYDYSYADARGADSVNEERALSDDSDPSYERDSYGLRFSLRFRKGFLSLNDISMGGEYQIYYFTSEKRPEEDPLHVGRQDNVYRVEITGGTRPVLGPAALEGGYRYTKRTSTAVEVAAGGDIGEEKDYTDNRAWFGIEIPF
ncbi:MAG: hypothetical protein ABIH26_13140 [Candidatus Eisenbacteria bacterium]